MVFKPEDMENIGEQMNALMENLSENGDMEEMEKLFPAGYAEYDDGGFSCRRRIGPGFEYGNGGRR